PERGVRIEWAPALGSLPAAGVGAWPLTHRSETPPLGLSVVPCALVTSRLTRFNPAGRLFLTAYVGMLAAFLVWGIGFLLAIPVSGITRALLLSGYPLLVITFPSGLLQSLTDWETLCRSSWHRSTGRGRPGRRTSYPKVSLHVPACAEPPELVIATLDALAALEYPNYEVLVIDNNTRDPALWRPVAAHCQRLGPRFRFFHLE